MKYVELWEITAIKWKYRSEIWMGNPLEILDLQEMDETINYSLVNLNRLRQIFALNLNIKD